jgi:predicted RNase H-like HicB family nuclease
MKVRDVVRLLLDDGWYLARTRGSHHRYEHPTKKGRVMSKYLVIMEPTATGYSAYPPDLPGCATTGRSQAEVEVNMKEAIQLHLEGLESEGQPVPPPRTIATYVEVAA